MAEEQDEATEYGTPHVTTGPQPPDPSLERWPTRGDRVFVDTSTVLRSERFPLLLLARVRRLRVFWSPYVAGEVARVATRAQILDSIKGGRSSRGEIFDDLEARRHVIDETIEQHELAWDSPTIVELGRAYSRGRIPLLPDRKDRPILTAALAVGASFLLSRDKGSFPHLQRFGAVLVCWDPDTFVTAYFSNNLDDYVLVCQEIGRIPQARLLK